VVMATLSCRRSSEYPGSNIFPPTTQACELVLAGQAQRSFARTRQIRRAVDGPDLGTLLTAACAAAAVKSLQLVLMRLRAWSERDPDWAIPVAPIIHTGVPHDLGPRRPRRRGRHRPRPRRRSTITGWAAVVVVPVTAVIPVLVRAPAVVPLVPRAPVMVVRGGRRRHRLGNGRGNSESR
jgi:hypothetical protein